MRRGEACDRTCAMQPMRTMLRRHRPTEMTANTDMAPLAGPGLAHTAPEATAALTRGTPGPGRVLVVDDDEITRSC